MYYAAIDTAARFIMAWYRDSNPRPLTMDTFNRQFRDRRLLPTLVEKEYITEEDGILRPTPGLIDAYPVEENMGMVGYPALRLVQ